ncbi:response regulator transcription factor [Bacillus sp. FJAT-45066]|uniref:response regulator transcription factor n=1 Tax=Bacillus sp. FJAT-45066 TaxID=2011010 RepID=UPI000BB7299B|nr:response regulator transcription factor [Bacillus sp. FJAT-45066]
MTTILLVDDEQRMLDLLSLYISPYGYKCIKKSTGKEAIDFLEENSVDLVLLDIMMPKMDGWATLQEIRNFSNVPVIMLTARTEIEDVVKGLKSGADDYITKPFNEKELLARIEAIIRRVGDRDSVDDLSFEGLTLHLHAYTATYHEKIIPLTRKEYELLKLFLSYPNKVFSREHLLNSLGFRLDTENRTIDSHIRNVRDKLRQEGFNIDKYLKTVWGIGYRWDQS